MPGQRRIVRDGVVVGLIAYGSVAAFYAVFDFLAARGLLYTVDLLGKALFRGLRDPAVLQLPIRPDLALVFWYNALHLVLSLVIGLVVVFSVAEAERRPERGPLVLLFLLIGFVVTVLAVGSLTSSFRSLLPWWSIVTANVLAMVTAGSYLVRHYPALPARLFRAAA